MVFDPSQPGLTQLPDAGLHGLLVRNAIQPLAREAFGKVPCFQLQRPHSWAAALLAKQAAQVRVAKAGLRAEGRVADDTPIETCQPPTSPHRPEHEGAQRQGPT